MREVLDLLLEFFISLLVIGGGGFLMYIGKGDSTFITSMIALVIYFWFQGRNTDKTVNNLLKQIPGLPVPVPVPTATTNTQQAPVNPSGPVLNPTTTNPTNPAVTGQPPSGNNI